MDVDDDDENDMMYVMMILVRYTIITLNVYLRSHENFHHRYYITFKTLIVDTV